MSFCRIRVSLRGFTLVEMLVATAIIAVLAALLFPALQSARQSATSAPCMNHQRQMVTALIAMAADNNGRLPDVAIENGGSDSDSLMVKLQAYLNLPTNKFPGRQVMRCPAAGKTNDFSYGVNYSTGERRVFARKAGETGNANNTGSQRLANLAPSIVLIADTHDPRNPESWLFYSPESPNWGPLTTDQDGDGVNDSGANLPPPRKFNCIEPRHGNLKNKKFICGAVDGSVKMLSIREWAENPRYWRTQSTN